MLTKREISMAYALLNGMVSFLAFIYFNVIFSVTGEAFLTWTFISACGVVLSAVSFMDRLRDKGS